MQGDVKSSLRHMIDRAALGSPRKAWVGRVQELVQEWKASVAQHVDAEILPMRPGTPLPRADRLPALRCYPCLRYRPRRNLDRHNDRSETCRPKLHSLLWLSGMGVAGRYGRQVRGAGPPRALLHRRWRHLVSPERIGKPRCAAASIPSPSSTTIILSIRNKAASSRFTAAGRPVPMNSGSSTTPILPGWRSRSALSASRYTNRASLPALSTRPLPQADQQ